MIMNIKPVLYLMMFEILIAIGYMLTSRVAGIYIAMLITAGIFIINYNLQLVGNNILYTIENGKRR